MGAPTALVTSAEQPLFCSGTGCGHVGHTAPVLGWPLSGCLLVAWPILAAVSHYPLPANTFFILSFSSLSRASNSLQLKKWSKKWWAMAPLSFEFQTLLLPRLSPSHQEQQCLAVGLHSSVHPLLCWYGDLCKAWPCTWHPSKQEPEWLLRPSKRWLPSMLCCCFLPSLATFRKATLHPVLGWITVLRTLPIHLRLPSFWCSSSGLIQVFPLDPCSCLDSHTLSHGPSEGVRGLLAAFQMVK